MKTIKTIQDTIKLALATSILIMFAYTNKANAQEIDKKLDKVKVQIVKALHSHNEHMVENAKEIMDKLVKKKYTPQRASFLGALTAKMAKYSFFPWTKLGYANDGSKLLDKALKQAPNNIDVRLNRFFAYIQFPDMLKKEHFTQEDARWLLAKKQALSSNYLDNANKALAMFFAKQKDEIKYKQYLAQIQSTKYKKDVLEFVKKIKK